MTDHLPVLQILLPLVGAPLCVLIRRGRMALGFGIVICWLTFFVSTRLLLQVLADGPISYAMGGWPVPYGIEYRVDVVNVFVLLFVSAIGAIVLSYAPRSIAAEVPREKHYLFVAAYLLCLAGLLGIAITGDLFNLFVFLEISSLSSYALISLGRDRRALTATFQYLILGTIGATFILIGIGLMYQMTGTLNMADMAQRLPGPEGVRTVLVAFAFLSVGTCIKMALFPLHLWLPDAYTYAPSVVTAFLASTATKVSVYILLRFVFTVYGVEVAFVALPLNAILMPLALTGIFVASAVAIFQGNVKRLLAYSSVAQVGYMVLGISLASVSGLTAGIVHMFNHALTKGGLFLAMGCIALRIGSVELDKMRGLGRTMPITMFLWVLGGLGLVGVPLTAGFITKWYLIVAALERGWWPVAVLLLISSLMALVYVWKVVEVAYFQEPPEGAEQREAPAALLIPTAVLIASTIFFGISTTWSAGIARRAAEALLGVGP